ncbi:YbhB/YbcL family Raf kinase inhibitor-like protein [Rhizosaccharibacter radicis]|uniref:YbhB/YbcL family Raf kinase inhibitor-like protein n=1 Tax=Rhizosaccharibacter radicis TaxID=2782605 RepID=A0ABT1VUF5_9PROT|nr:YbhB/YbcL family Raf kinase inhibitor-like protein [Acetobacteraceae bacterium KSS12]
MLQKIPAGLGRALQNMRHGPDELASGVPAFENVPEVIGLTSPAFATDGGMPARFTDDGEGISPPLEWVGVPPEAEALVLMIEDMDSPTPKPLVHAILADLPPRDGGLPEGALPGSDHVHENETLGMGRNSFLRRAYLPPDPPRGHGPHRYAFQLFALDSVPEFRAVPGRRALLEALEGHVIARGLLIGTYERR